MSIHVGDEVYAFTAYGPVKGSVESIEWVRPFDRPYERQYIVYGTDETGARARLYVWEREMYVHPDEYGGDVAAVMAWQAWKDEQSQPGGVKQLLPEMKRILNPDSSMDRKRREILQVLCAIITESGAAETKNGAAYLIPRDIRVAARYVFALDRYMDELGPEPTQADMIRAILDTQQCNDDLGDFD